MNHQTKSASIVRTDGMITEIDVVIHGITDNQSFSGCGTTFTEYMDVATGIGNDAGEAFDEALECLAQNGWNVSGWDGERPNPDEYENVLELMANMGDDEDFSNHHFYVSIRVR